MPLPLSQLDEVTKYVSFFRAIKQIQDMLAADPEVNPVSVLNVFAELDTNEFFTIYAAALITEIEEDLNNLDVDQNA